MKKITLIFLLLIASKCCFSQDQLQVHHINVEDGDATLIGIYDQHAQKFKNAVLIDGGNSNAADLLLPYLKSVTGESNPHFNYIALTHYHKDHYNGLLALATGAMSTDSVIDPAGYNITDVFPQQHMLQSELQKPAAMTVAPRWLSALKTAALSGFVKGHAMGFVNYDSSRSSVLGKKIIVGLVNNMPVMLECVAGWGNTLNGNGISTDPYPSKSNANDFTLSFILTCGQFRYFIGGDLGGSNDGEYIDQESSLIREMAVEFPKALPFGNPSSVPVSGHLCGFKADHHGSDHSNGQEFMNAMHPSVIVTSAGREPNWHLPSVAYLKRLALVKPISSTVPGSLVKEGIYFTNLYDFTPVSNSLTTAKNLFEHKTGISFSYGNDTTGKKSGYIIKIDGNLLGQQSSFTVFRADNNGRTQQLIATINCHHL